MAGWCYILSGLLDAFDGHAARELNQSTKFGAMLDMLTDRCATMCLLATLSPFYPKWLFFFQLSMTIDISCHWIHLHTSLLEKEAIRSSDYIIHPDLYSLACVLEMRYFMLRCIYCILPMDPSTYSISQQSSVFPLQ